MSSGRSYLTVSKGVVVRARREGHGCSGSRRGRGRFLGAVTTVAHLSA